MFKNFKNNIFRKRVLKYLSANQRERRFVNYNKAKTVLLLFESDYSEKNPQIRKIIFSMQQDGKKVIAWGFVDKKEVATAILPEFRILHHKQTDFMHKPAISYINELQNFEFDLLIDLTLRPVLTLQYLAMYANASCKVGMKRNIPIYDFMLDIERKSITDDVQDAEETQTDETYLFNQIIFYLKSIQTND